MSDETRADAEEVRASIDWVRDCLLHLMRQSASLPAPERAEAGRHLAKLGDTRPSVLDVDHIEWCHIPAGDFIMGSGDDDDLAYDNEKPQPTYRIRHAYDICTYPITNAQFEQFVKDKGYERAEFWGAAIAAERWANGRVTDYAGERDRPRDYGEPFNLANHPVVGVTWYEAVAFTVWLSQRLGQVVSLPTEAEWERAARGTAGLRYPWGNDPDPDKANYHDTGIGTPSAVGCFPQGVQLQTGCEDMSGNVWEWTMTKWTGDYKDYDRKADNKPDGSEVARVVRGGSFLNFGCVVARCAFRINLYPSSHIGRLWFSACCVPHLLNSELCLSEH